MDIKEYISSGIIEAYAAGLASEEEIRILECIQMHNPEVKQAVEDAQKTMEDFASKLAIAPPPELKATIWAKISDAKLVEQTPVKLNAEALTTPIQPTSPLKNNNVSLKWFSAAACFLLLLSISLNLYYNSAQKEATAELVSIKMEQKNNATAYQNLKDKWDLANNPNVKTVALLGVAKHPNLKAVVYFEQKSKEVYLTLENLPPAPQNQQYQLWAIVDGQPVSLGVFDQMASAEVQKMLSVNTVQAFAITLEKRGGSPTPTMENMYVMGNT